MSFPQYTIPSEEVQFAAEDITWGIDTTAVMSGAQTPTAVTVTLKNPSGTVVTLADTPTVAGNVISQRVRAGVLTPSGGSYWLTATFTPSGTTNVLVSALALRCPQ